MKKRIDIILVDKKITDSRTKAQKLIKFGKISINKKKVLKSNKIYDSNLKINLDSSYIEWVSRGAIKLLHALNYFKINVTNFKCLDIGASTGGFTEVLLSKKAKKVYSVDVGSNQLHQKLINNTKVINISQTNAKYLNRDIISDLVNIIVCDVSFISMKKVIEPSLKFLEKKNGIIIALIKPQFESEKKEIKKRGIITDHNVHKRICNYYEEWFSSFCKMKVLGITQSPIKGSKGNIEFLICAKLKL